MLTQAEFEAILADESKSIDSDIVWSEDEDHSPTVEFRAEVTSEPGYPLFVCGSYNAVAETLSFSLIHKGVGRVYALDMGKDHRNPNGQLVGEKHKHKWREPVRDKEAYVPDDITAPVTAPHQVWEQFCAESAITHNGRIQPPPPVQQGLFE